MASINWSKVDEEIGKAFGHLNSNNLTKVREALQKFRELFLLMLSNLDRKQLADKLADRKFVESAKTIFVNIDSQNQPSQSLAYEVMVRVVDMLMCLTNHSPVVCRLVVENDIHQIIAREVKRNSSSHPLERLLIGNGSNRVEVTNSCLCILMNIMRLHPDSREQLQSTGIQDNLVQLKGSQEPRQKLFAIMTLCLLIENATASSHLLQVSKKDIEFLLRGVLMKSIADKAMDSMFSQMFGFGEKIQTVSADEMFQCLSILATNRDNALEMIKQGAVSQCESFLQFSSDQSQPERGELTPHSVNNAVKWSLNLLRRLKSSVPEISVLFTFQDVLTKLKDHPNDDISQFAEDLIIS